MIVGHRLKKYNVRKKDKMVTSISKTGRKIKYFEKEGEWRYVESNRKLYGWSKLKEKKAV
jgi:hypothetical protein